MRIDTATWVAAYLCVSLRQKWRRQLSLTMAHPRIDASDVMREPAGRVFETMECVNIIAIKQNKFHFECYRMVYDTRIKVLKEKQLNTKHEISKISNILSTEVKHG